MDKKVFAVAGLSGSGKSNLIELFQAEFTEINIIDLEEVGNELLQFGGEGYRQIINYFGESYVKKDGQLNLNKLWKFVYGDQHKLKILDFMFEPLLINQVQKSTENLKGIIVIEGINFHASAWNKIVSKKIWVENFRENILENLGKKKMPINAKKYLDIQERLYGLKQPEGYYLFNNSDLGQRKKNWLELKTALSI